MTYTPLHSGNIYFWLVMKTLTFSLTHALNYMTTSNHVLLCTKPQAVKCGGWFQPPMNKNYRNQSQLYQNPNNMEWVNEWECRAGIGPLVGALISRFVCLATLIPPTLEELTTTSSAQTDPKALRNWISHCRSQLRSSAKLAALCRTQGCETQFDDPRNQICESL